MTEVKEEKHYHESPKDQVSRQSARDAVTGEEPAEGEPFHYSAPTNPTAGVTKSPPNEVKPDQWDVDGNPIPVGSDVEAAYGIDDEGNPIHPPAPELTHEHKSKKKTGESGSFSESETEDDYESMTVPELRELATSRGVPVRADMNKAEIIKALKKG